MIFRNLFFFFAAMTVATMGLLSCERSTISLSGEGDDFSEGAPCEVNFSLPSLVSTRSTTVTADDEVEVVSLQVFVFRGDALDAYGAVSSSSEITLSCTSGDRVAFALVNAPDLSSISTKTALLGTVSLLSNNSIGSFEMIGSCPVTLPQASTVTIDVNRFVSKISIEKITRSFTSASLAAKSMSIEEIFITNVAGDVNYGMSVSPTIWHNKQGYTESLPSLTHDAPAASLANGSAYTQTHAFFAYPNGSDDSTAESWSPRRTRLVVKVRLGDDTYYYPITLPELEPNKSYVIENLTLTRPGSDSPDIPVSFADCTFEVNVLPWTVVPVTSGVTI